MAYVVENYIDIDDDFSALELTKLAKFVLDNEDAPENSCASLIFISKDNIHQLNKKYRGIDKPTDVLSFECDFLDDDFDTGEILEYGDVFICPKIAKQNSIKFDNSFENELKLLTVHGMLHLCGYDHMTDEDAKIMEAKEDKLLEKWESICRN